MYEAGLADLCADSNNAINLYSAGEGLISGLTANSWNYLSPDGKLYLCSNNGVTVFNVTLPKYGRVHPVQEPI